MGWGGITATLITVVKAGLNRSSQGKVQPVSPKEEVEVPVDASTSTSDLRIAVQARRKETATWSIKDERRSVEWPQRSSPTHEDKKMAR